MKQSLMFVLIAAAALLPACKEDHGHPHGAAAPKAADPHAGQDQAKGHGASVPIGEADVPNYLLVASRDEGALKPGGEAAIDVSITPVGAAPKPSAVRFWIGAVDGKGAMKAKAEIEDPKKPNGWHTHVEIPDPFGADAKLCVEIEAAGGVKQLAVFELKR